MDNQLPLFVDEGVAGDFQLFHLIHPEVYQAYCRTVEELWEAGCRRFGSRGVFWVVRWKYNVNPERDDGFKLNNKYSPHYARKYIEEHPERCNFFETRQLKT